MGGGGGLLAVTHEESKSKLPRIELLQTMICGCGAIVVRHNLSFLSCTYIIYTVHEYALDTV